MKESEHNQEHCGPELESIAASALKGPQGLEIFDRIREFIKKLEAEHGDLEEYKLYHLILGSTPQITTG